MYGKEDILKKLPNQNHEFLEHSYPYTINPGGPNHEELCSLVGIYEYFESFYNHHFSDINKTLRDKVKKINELISKHEEKIANPLLDYLNSRKDLKLIGQKKIKNKNRAPTITFLSNKISSKDLSDHLVKNRIATRNDNFYAWRCLKALGIDDVDGVVRTSIVHYNSSEDIEKLIESLDKI